MSCTFDDLGLSLAVYHGGITMLILEGIFRPVQFRSGFHGAVELIADKLSGLFLITPHGPLEPNTRRDHIIGISSVNVARADHSCCIRRNKARYDRIDLKRRRCGSGDRVLRFIWTRAMTAVSEKFDKVSVRRGEGSTWADPDGPCLQFLGNMESIDPIHSVQAAILYHGQCASRGDLFGILEDKYHLAAYKLCVLLQG